MIQENEPKVYILKPLYLNNDREGCIEHFDQLYFSSLSEAETAIAHYPHQYAAFCDHSSRELYCLLLEECAMNQLFPSISRLRVYSPSGERLNRQFLHDAMHLRESNSDYPSSTYQRGDIIETPLGERLYLGVVKDYLLEEGVYHSTDLVEHLPLCEVILYPSMSVEYVHNELLFQPRCSVDPQISDSLRNALCQEC